MVREEVCHTEQVTKRREEQLRENSHCLSCSKRSEGETIFNPNFDCSSVEKSSLMLTCEESVLYIVVDVRSGKNSRARVAVNHGPVKRSKKVHPGRNKHRPRKNEYNTNATGRRPMVELSREQFLHGVG